MACSNKNLNGECSVDGELCGVDDICSADTVEEERECLNYDEPETLKSTDEDDEEHQSIL